MLGIFLQVQAGFLFSSSECYWGSREDVWEQFWGTLLPGYHDCQHLSRVRQLECLELLTICRHSLQWFSHLLVSFSSFKALQMQHFLISKEGCHPSLWSCPRHSVYTSYTTGKISTPMSFYLFFQEFSILRTNFLVGEFIGQNEPKRQSLNKANNKKHYMSRLQKSNPLKAS